MGMPFPALRPVETFVVEHEGAPQFCLYDPAGYIEEQLILSPHAFLVASCLDGESDAGAVQRVFAEHSGGILVPEEQIEKVVEYLDGCGFLLSSRFDEIRDRVEASFRNAPVRPATLAGKSYPDDPAELRAFIDGFFTSDGGPGALPDSGPPGAPPLRALIAPHIDFTRGGAAYAHAYRKLYGAGKPDTVFLFGVAHAGAPSPFVLTRKAFETPFGTLEVDQTAVDAIEAACGWKPCEFEIVHRKEHSLEFQAVMLAYLYGSRVKIVPILCGMLAEEPDCAEPGQVRTVARFLEGCRAYAAPAERHVTAIAGADLAHVGRRFGDMFDIDDEVIAEIRDRDLEDLECANAVDPEGWYASVMQDGNERKVCGLACIYSTLKTIEGSSTHGELLHYGYAPDPAGGVVSFASMQFT